MTKKQHQIQTLKLIYDSLVLARVYSVSHIEWSDLHKQLDNLCDKVSKMLEELENMQ